LAVNAEIARCLGDDRLRSAALGFVFSLNRNLLGRQPDPLGSLIRPLADRKLGSMKVSNSLMEGGTGADWGA
jgi:hypothetical protein